MRKALALAFLAISAPATGPAWAQTDSSKPQVAALEKITVTARKRVEDEQAVPISITALDQADLDKLSIKTIEDLKYVSPSVYIAPTAFRQDTLNITIRGQRNFDAPSGGGNPGLAFDTASAVYKDGVYYARALGLTGSLFDLDNVAVLKGPQGTLVGRNSTGGAVLYNSRTPGPDLGGYVQATVGDYGRAGLQGALNLPLSDTVFFRAALNSENQKGYINNFFFDPASGRRNTQAAFGFKKLAGIFSLKWQPDETFDLVLRADVSSEHDTGSTYHDLGFFTGTVASNGRTSICNIPVTCLPFTDLRGQVMQPYYLTSTATSVSNPNPSPQAYNAILASVLREQNYGFWSAEQDISNLSQGHYQTYSATANKSFDDIDVRLMAAYRTFDNTGTAVSRGLPFESNTYNYNFPKYESWQSELTVNGKALDNKLLWTTGLFYFNERSPNDGGFLYQFLPGAAGPPTAAAGKQFSITDWSNNSEENSSYAAYAQGTYSIWSDTRFTAGVRYTYDERFAHIATQSIRTPATPATNATLTNAVFNPASFTYNGISYAGQSNVCLLTNANGVTLPLSQCAADIRKSYHKPTYTLALDHDLWDGTLVYATMRSGYRSGGINTQAQNISALTALPEQVQDYEIGVKSDWELAGVPLRTNFALYETSYHNIQVQQQVPNVTLATAIGGGQCTQALFNAGNCVGFLNENVTLNAKAAKIYGVEWEITAIPTDWLTLNASGSYIDPRYTDFTFIVPAGYLQPASGTNLSGTPIPVPAWQTNETATVNFGTDLGGLPLGDTTFTAHYYWQSRYLADLRSFNPLQRTFAYGLLNFRLEFTDIGHVGADLALFMNNVANTEACLPEYNGVLNSAPNGTFGSPGTSGVLQCIPLAPRMTGVTLGYKF
ncbi:MAG: TonB-dependent receptor [Alphaproteobacteria bacterium]|nr:TonB-dependent receptor [Alphaproteobacteria bacterium]